MADINALVDQLSALTVLEAAELSKALEEKWGVSAAAAVAVAAPAGGAPAAAAEEVKDEFDVVLTGDGGDEALSGYDTHLRWLDWAHSGQGSAANQRRLTSWEPLITYCTPDIRRRLWDGAHPQHTLLPIESLEQAWLEARDLTPAQRLRYMDTVTYLPNDILTKVDIASMSASLETRTPFIDVRLWDLIAELPDRLLLNREANGRSTGKHPLKRFLSQWFPSEFVHRRKQGFVIPISRWFASEGEARQLVEDRILGPESALRAVMNPEGMQDLLNQRAFGPVWVLLVLEEWLRQLSGHGGMHPTVTVGDEPIPVVMGEGTATPLKPRLLIVYDVPNWIFERHARTLQSLLCDDFEIHRCLFTEPFDEDAWDLIYVMEFGLISDEQVMQPWKYVTGVRSHVSWNNVPAPVLAKIIRDRYQRAHVVSRRLHDLLAPWYPEVTYVTHGIDGERFAFSMRAPSEGRPLRVGWAGNRLTPAKGFQQFIEPLARIPGVELAVCGYADRNLSKEEVAEWYRSVDVYVCASDSEGSNNALLEAAATGCAIVTTDVGTVPEFLRHDIEALIVPREAEAFVAAIERLRDDPPLRERIGRAASDAVHPAWTWAVRAEDFRRFFREALEQVPYARAHMATRTGPGRRWIHRNSVALQACLEQDRHVEALELLDALMDADPDNGSWIELRRLIVDGGLAAAAP